MLCVAMLCGHWPPDLRVVTGLVCAVPGLSSGTAFCGCCPHTSILPLWCCMLHVCVLPSETFHCQHTRTLCCREPMAWLGQQGMVTGTTQTPWSPTHPQVQVLEGRGHCLAYSWGWLLHCLWCVGCCCCWWAAWRLGGSAGASATGKEHAQAMFVFACAVFDDCVFQPPALQCGHCTARYLGIQVLLVLSCHL